MEHRPLRGEEKSQHVAGRLSRRRFRRRSVFWRWRRLLFLAMLVLVAGMAGLALILTNIELPPLAEGEEVKVTYPFLFTR